MSKSEHDPLCAIHGFTGVCTCGKIVTSSGKPRWVAGPQITTITFQSEPARHWWQRWYYRVRNWVGR